MKRSILGLGILAASIAEIGVAHAGSLSYQGVTGDADSGISTSNTYTAKVDYGNQFNSIVVNGVTFDEIAAFSNPTSLTATGLTASVASGSYTNYNGNAWMPVTGNVGTAYSDFVYNLTSDATTVQTFTLTDLTVGQTYDYRVYMRAWAADVNPGNRVQTFDFTGDGATTSVTLNADDATTAPGAGFTAWNQGYYINYQFTYDGISAPGVTVTAADVANGYHAYLMTNQVAVPEPASLGLLASIGLLLMGRRRA